MGVKRYTRDVASYEILAKPPGGFVFAPLTPPEFVGGHLRVLDGTARSSYGVASTTEVSKFYTDAPHTPSLVAQRRLRPAGSTDKKREYVIVNIIPYKSRKVTIIELERIY